MTDLCPSCGAHQSQRFRCHPGNPSGYKCHNPFHDAVSASVTITMVPIDRLEAETHRADMAEFRLNATQNVLRAFIKDNPDAKMLAEVLLEVQCKASTDV